MRSRVKKRLLTTAAVLAAAIGIVEILAFRDARRQKAARTSLGNLLYTRSVGRGDPLVFLAGFGGTTDYWTGAFDQLATSHRLLFIDALGFGKSPWPDVEYTIDDHVAALQRTLAAHGADQNVTFVAHSFGTMLAAYYAKRYPDDVRRLVLIGTPMFANAAEAEGRVGEMSVYGKTFSVNRLVAREACMVMAAFRPVWTRVVERAPAPYSPAVARGWLENRWASVDGTMRHVVFGRPIIAALVGAEAQIIFVHGTQDRVTELTTIQAAAQKLDATVVTTRDTHHTYVANSRHQIQQVIVAE